MNFALLWLLASVSPNEIYFSFHPFPILCAHTVWVFFLFFIRSFLLFVSKTSRPWLRGWDGRRIDSRFRTSAFGAPLRVSIFVGLCCSYRAIGKTVFGPEATPRERSRVTSWLAGPFVGGCKAQTVFETLLARSAPI